MSDGYVVCASCGARIKANRERCLRCEAPLIAARPAGLPLPAWLHALGGGTFIFVVVGVLAVLVIALTIWDSSSSSTDVARPAASATPAANPESPAKPADAPAPGPAFSLWSATFLDVPPKGRADASPRDLAAAREQYEKALARKPDDPDALNNLGLTLERMGQIDDAIARYARAVQLGSQNWAYHVNLAHASAQARDWTRAVSEYRIAGSLYPTNGATRYHLGLTLQQKGDDMAAIPAFEKAIELAPNEPTYHLALAASLDKADRSADARSEYQRYVDLAPEGRDAEAVRARLR